MRKREAQHYLGGLQGTENTVTVVDGRRTWFLESRCAYDFIFAESSSRERERRGCGHNRLVGVGPGFVLIDLDSV